MKQKMTLTLISAMLFSSFQVMAQWTTNVPGNTVRLSVPTRKVGIGVDPANSKLHVKADSAGLNGLRVDILNSTKLLVSSNGGVSVGSSSTPPGNGLFVLGNAGFGTTSPSAKLHIIGGTDADVSGGGHIILGSLSGFNIALDENEIMARNNGATSELALNAGGGNVDLSAHSLFVQGANKNVGIGTTGPAVKLHVDGGTDANLSGGGYILTNSTAAENVVIDENEIMARNNGVASPLTLNNDGGNVIINGTNTSSRVGIGTISPSAKFHIVGGSDVNPGSGGYLVTGSTTGENVAIDENEIMARNNGVAATLYLNYEGGIVQTGSDLDVNGNNINLGSIERFSDQGDATIETNSNFVPSSSCLRTLGSSAYRWNEVWACNPFIQTSDVREKKNIRDLNYGINEIMKLHPVRFNWLNKSDQSDKLGVIAQEIKQVLPEVVRDYEFKENEKTGVIEKVPATVIGVAYTDIIPVLIRSIQQQQKMIEDQDRKIEELMQHIAGAPASGNATNKGTQQAAIAKSSHASLEQNTPNPFNQVTTIRYRIPAGSNGQIAIYNQSGKLVKTLKATESGSSQISANELSAGTYTYSLSINGRLIESKKMVMVK